MKPPRLLVLLAFGLPFAGCDSAAPARFVRWETTEGVVRNTLNENATRADFWLWLDGAGGGQTGVVVVHRERSGTDLVPDLQPPVGTHALGASSAFAAQVAPPPVVCLDVVGAPCGPAWAYEAERGTLTVTESAPGRLAGSFRFTARATQGDRPFGPAVQVEGTFRAATTPVFAGGAAPTAAEPGG